MWLYVSILVNFSTVEMKKVVLLLVVATSASGMELFPAATVFPFVCLPFFSLQVLTNAAQDILYFPNTQHNYGPVNVNQRVQVPSTEIWQDKTSPVLTISQSYQPPPQEPYSIVGNTNEISPGPLQSANQENSVPIKRSNLQKVQNGQMHFPETHQERTHRAKSQYVDLLLNRQVQLSPNQQNIVQTGMPVVAANMGHIHHKSDKALKTDGLVVMPSGATASSAQGQDQVMDEDNTAAQPVQHADPVSASVTGFGMEVIKSLESIKPGNSVVSPYSIALILAMLQQGTEGESQLQITKALRMTPIQSSETFRRYVTRVKKRLSRNILNVATSIFFSNTFDVNSQYKKDAIQYFNSDLASVNFNNPQLASSLINNWVSTGTQGHIPFIVSPDSFSADTQMVLANAVFFKGLWNETFNAERTIPRPFHLAGGVMKQTSFMHHSGMFKAGYYKKLDADFLVMPFEGLQYSLISIVPSTTTNVTYLLGRLSHEDLLTFLRSLEREVIISIPKFNIRIDTDLYRPLNALGIRNIFTQNSGLSAIGDPRGGVRPVVTGALHTAMLSIDEQGGSAAGATLLSVSTLSINLEDLEFRFHADRPFVTILWDHELNVPLFIAKIVDPVNE